MPDPSLDAVKSAIAHFLSLHLRRPISNGDRLLTSGMVNSLLSMELVLFVEQQFQITVDAEDLDRSNFDTVDGIMSLVVRKLERTG